MNKEINTTAINTTYTEEEQIEDIQYFIHLLNGFFMIDYHFNKDGSPKDDEKEIIEDQVEKLAIDFGGELPPEFYSMLTEAGYNYCYNENDEFVISKWNRYINIYLNILIYSVVGLSKVDEDEEEKTEEETEEMEETDEIQNFIKLLDDVFNNDENFELDTYSDAYREAMESPEFSELMDDVPFIAKNETNKLVEDELEKLKNNFLDKELPGEFYSALGNTEYYSEDGTDWDYGFYVFSKGNKRVLVKSSLIYNY